MKKFSPFMQGFDNLPNTMGIFPLNNAVVMPGSQLPLNIFEPRYLNMVNDAIESHKLIGMIQPRDETQKSDLFNVGCAARITRYEEMNDGRLEITLTGLCRFEIEQEIESTRGYRLVIPSWEKYRIDFTDDSIQKEPNIAFVAALKSYFNKTEFELDWDAMAKLNSEVLFNSLYGFIEQSKEDKQLLLEIDTLEKRVKALTSILDNNVKPNVVRH